MKKIIKMKGTILPPYYSTGDPGSFANKTLRHRKPAIIDQVIEANDFSSSQRKALLALKDEILSGAIPDSFSDPSLKLEGMEEESIRLWKKSLKPQAGASWLNVPFYFAEALLYLRILMATGYFDTRSPFYLRDPYELFKRRELFSMGGVEKGRTIAHSIQEEKDVSRITSSLLYFSLWGNRVDLSLFSVAEKARDRIFEARENKLLIDHTNRLVHLIDQSRRIDVILDNAGQELVCDLILVWHLLSSSTMRTVHLHAKHYPLYVSDAMEKDVAFTVKALMEDPDGALSRIGGDLRTFQSERRLWLHSHHFWNSPLHFTELPQGLYREFSRSDLVVLKGDVNYRRLLEDRQWEPWRKMEELASYFPTAFATLRTMKSEIVVDLDEERVKALSAEDPEWRVNGERGIIRVVKKTKF